MVEQINHVAQWWWDWSLAMFWQVGLLIALIALADRLIRRWAWPQLRYALWSLVLVKLILSPGLTLPSALVPKLRPVLTQVLAQAGSEPEVAVAPPSMGPFLDDSFTQFTAQSGTHLMLAAEATPAASDFVDDQKPVQATGVRLAWQSYIMALWLLGMLTLASWLSVKLRRLSRAYPDNSGRAVLPQSFYEQLDQCAERLGLRCRPVPVVTNRLQTPAVFGVFRPVLLMPVGCLRKLSRRDTEHLLLHELAHIKRGDLLVHSLYILLQVVYWYNPLLWLVRRRLRHLRELCCDATVAGLLRNRTVEYRRTLLEAARQFLVTPVEYGLGLVGLFEDSNCLISRINCLEKPIWRYQKMKQIVAITLALILLACVLPMAEAQPEAVPESSNAGSVLSETNPAKGSDTARIERAQAQKLEQLAESMQALQVQLQQLELQRQKLQQDMQAIAHTERQARQGRDRTEQVLITKEFSDADLAKDALPALAADASVPIVADETVKGHVSCRLEDVTLEKALAMVLAGTGFSYKKMPDHYLVYSHANKAKDKAAKTAERAKKAKAKSVKEKTKAQTEHWQKWAHHMQGWAKGVEKWAESDEFKQWEKDLQKWATDLAKTQMTIYGSANPSPAPTPKPMPVMPPMPSMQVPAAPTTPMPCDVVLPDVRTILRNLPLIGGVAEIASAAPVVAPPKTPVLGDVPVISPPEVTTETALTLPGEKASTGEARDIEVKEGKGGKFVATRQMEFVSKVKPGTPFVIRNQQGRIVLRPSKDGTCDIRAVIRGKGGTPSEACDKMDKVGMNIESSDERYLLRPITRDGGQWQDLSVDLFITVPPGIEPDVETKMGRVDLYDLKGKIKVVTDMGAIKAVNTTGDLDLLTKMGAIEFIAPKKLSAKLNVQTKMGSIKSDLPLSIHQHDMFRKSGQATLGTGQGNVRMTTNMGSINLKWYTPAEDSPVIY